MKLKIEELPREELDKMRVTTSRITHKMPEQTTSVIKLTRDEINNSPGAFGDINQVIMLLPSATNSAGEYDNAFRVRGGSE